MQRKTISFVLSILTMLAVVTVVIGAVNLYYEMPMSATIQENPEVMMYLGTSQWTNETDVGWGTLMAGSQTTKTFNVLNTGNVALQVIATVSGLPQDWDLVYSRNGSTIQPGVWLNGTLSLTTSSMAENGTHQWTLGFSFT